MKLIFAIFESLNKVKSTFRLFTLKLDGLSAELALVIDIKSQKPKYLLKVLKRLLCLPWISMHGMVIYHRNPLKLFLLWLVIIFGPLLMVLITIYQPFEMGFSYVKVSNDFCDLFTSFVKWLEDYTSNSVNQKTNISCESKNLTPSNPIIEQNSTKNLEINLKPKDIETTGDTGSTNSSDGKKSKFWEIVSNKYFIGGVVLVLAGGAYLICNPDVAANCYNGIKNLFGKNDINLPKKKNVLGIMEKANIEGIGLNFLENAIAPQVDKVNMLPLKLVNRFHNPPVEEALNMINAIPVRKTLEAVQNPLLFDVVHNAVGVQTMIPQQTTASLLLVIPFALGLIFRSFSPEVKKAFVENVSNINTNTIDFTPKIISQVLPKTYMFKDVRTFNLKVRGFSVENLVVDKVRHRNFGNTLQIRKFNMGTVNCRGFNMNNVSFTNLKFDSISFSTLSFDANALWDYLAITEQFAGFKHLEYKEVLAILTLGLLISALCSHTSPFGAYPSLNYGNETRLTSEFMSKYQPEFTEVWKEHVRLQLDKINNFQWQLTEDEIRSLHGRLHLEGRQFKIIRTLYLGEELESLANTTTMIEDYIRSLRQLNKSAELIEIYTEKLEYMRRIGNDILAAQRALK